MALLSRQACVLLAAGLVSAQLINDPAPVDVGALDAAPSAGVAASPAAPAGAGPGAGAAAGAPATQNFGPAFYGEGLNNPAAFPPSMLVIRRYQQLAKIRPEIRVVCTLYLCFISFAVLLTSEYKHTYGFGWHSMPTNIAWS